MTIAPVLAQFFGRLQDHWIWLLGLWFMLEPAADALFEGYRSWADSYVSRRLRTRISWAVAASTAIIACFLAFQDQFNATVAATGQRDTVIGERDEARRQRDANVSPTQQTTINRLSGDLTAARGKIDEQEQQIKSQQEELAGTSKKLGELANPPRENDVLYQNNRAIGRVAGLSLDATQQNAAFQALSTDREIDFSKEMELQRARLVCASASGKPTGMMTFGAARTLTYTDVTCRVVGVRQ
jgi:hypothetical protein